MIAQNEVLILDKRLESVGFNQIPAVTSLTGSITGATKANPCVITSATHGLATGQKVTITSVAGMTQLNNLTFTITKIDTNSFSLDGINSTGYSTYTSGGTWTVVAIGLGAGLTSNAIPTGATYALMQAETQSIRWRDDGVAPTSSIGMLLASGISVWLRSLDLSAVQIIRTVAGGITNISFYRESQPNAEA